MKGQIEKVASEVVAEDALDKESVKSAIKKVKGLFAYMDSDDKESSSPYGLIQLIEDLNLK